MGSCTMTTLICCSKMLPEPKCGSTGHEAHVVPHRQVASLPATKSTSGRIHGESLCLLHILSHRQTVKFFDTYGEEPFDNAFTFCQAAYLFHNRATLGLRCAKAIAFHMHVAPHTVHRPLRAHLREHVSTSSSFSQVKQVT